MRTQEALRKIRRHRPISPKGFKSLGLLGAYIGGGVFRETFRIKGTNLIVKFPLNEAESGIGHMRTEMRRLAKINQVKALRPHLPKVWYYDKSYGIIVMTRYIQPSKSRTLYLMGEIIRKLVKQYAHTEMNDIHEDNMMMTAGKNNKRLVFVDLGY